jgi:hypothetical protein
MVIRGDSARYANETVTRYTIPADIYAVVAADGSTTTGPRPVTPARKNTPKSKCGA